MKKYIYSIPFSILSILLIHLIFLSLFLNRSLVLFLNRRDYLETDYYYFEYNSFVGNSLKEDIFLNFNYKNKIYQVSKKIKIMESYSKKKASIYFFQPIYFFTNSEIKKIYRVINHFFCFFNEGFFLVKDPYYIIFSHPLMPNLLLDIDTIYSEKIYKLILKIILYQKEQKKKCKKKNIDLKLDILDLRLYNKKNIILYKKETISKENNIILRGGYNELY